MPTWMAVEDEMDIHSVILGMFEIWGIDGVLFVDGAEAVRWLNEIDSRKVTQGLPELALIDIRLPQISGIEVSARIRQSKYLGNMPIILTTAYRLTVSEERQIIADAQADALIYKPLPPLTHLRQTLGTVIADRKKTMAQALRDSTRP